MTAIDPLTAGAVLLATAATDAVYVMFTSAVVARKRVPAATWSSVWYVLSSYAVISYTENWVYFTGFTRLVETMEPASVIDQLDQHFTRFDDIMANHRLEKLKTIGDAYLAVGGVPEPNRSHAIDAALAALQVIDHLAKLNRQREKLHLPAWQVRIGINTGPVIAGVVGKHKFTYDIWGNTVNITQRVEAAGEPGRISIAESTWQHIKTRFETDARGAVEVKHHGLVNMYYLNRIRVEFASDSAGMMPNDRFWKQE